jgi:UDP-2-acetamido-2,6-beta-L-arabino-hexul-4-ose reductase
VVQLGKILNTFNVEKIKLGITGQSGFIGTHLYNVLGLHAERFIRVPFEDNFFDDEKRLNDFVQNCDVIVHLAAMNRHNEPEIIFSTNVGLVNKLIQAMGKMKVSPHVIFSSSTQEEKDNLYGKSKLEGRRLLIEWAEKNKAIFTGLVIPNVFGPFGHPYYNSAVATFSHQLTHGETPQIVIDGEMKLIYVGELVELILMIIEKGLNQNEFVVPHSKTIKVSALLEQLIAYTKSYFDNGIFPDLSDSFNRNLFNTFVCYIEHKTYFPRLLTKHADNRGIFVEISKVAGGQNSFSTTLPEITRGNHYHTRKAERFTVIKGKAKLELRRIGTVEVLEFIIDGDNNPGYVDIPIWFTHNITNIGVEELSTVFWISEHYNPKDADTFFEKV